MSKYEEIAAEIVKQVGGKENILDVTHCATRLRFKLKNEDKANDSALKNNSDVVSIVKGGGQYMVVIGTYVNEVYAEVVEYLGEAFKGKEEVAGKKMTPFQTVLDVLQAVISPIVGLLCAAGMARGLLSIAASFGWMSYESGIYLLLFGIADSTMHFLPVLIGAAAAKKFKMDSYLGAVLGLVLVYPGLQNIDLNILGQTINVSYVSSFLPVIFTCLFGSVIYRWCNRHMPRLIRYFMTPLLTVFIAGIAGFLLIGPVINWVAAGVLSFFRWIMDLSPVASGGLIGGLFQVLVVTGLHSIVVFASIADVLEGNPNFFLAASCLICLSQAAVVGAVSLKTKDQKLKGIGISAFISAIFGITEPAIYSVTLPRIKLFVISCIGGAITGVLLGVFNVNYYAFTGDGLFTFPSYVDPADPKRSLICALIAAGAGILFSFVTAFLLYKDEEPKAEERSSKPETDNKTAGIKVVLTPVSGKVIPLTEVKDDMFSSKALGDGVAIDPAEGTVIAPITGTVSALFPTGHAIGLTGENGVELLIHIGIDTVKMDGRGFTTRVQAGDTVKAGDLLVEFTPDEIRQAGYSPATIVIVTNMDRVTEVIPTEKNEVQSGDQLMLVI